MAESSFAEIGPEAREAGDAPAVPLGHGAQEDLAVLQAPRLAAAAPPREGEIIQPGRSLILADFAPPSLGPGERLIRLAYRLGIPGSMLTSPLGRKARTRLLATVASPLPGNRVAGTAIRAGHFLVHGAKTPIAQIDFAGAARMPPPLERVVHSFSWLADLSACAPREQCTQVAERILSAWLKANPAPPSRPKKAAAWTVGHTAARLLNWLVYAPLLLSGKDRGLRSLTLHSITDQARWLDRNVQRAEDGLAETTAWCAIIAAGLLLTDGKPRRLFGESTQDLKECRHEFVRLFDIRRVS
ncbi:MAG: heparinase, partial [Novosphingobium sp.]|nr:heparinase [Novosphingobium sp.]